MSWHRYVKVAISLARRATAEGTVWIVAGLLCAIMVFLLLRGWHRRGSLRLSHLIRTEKQKIYGYGLRERFGNLFRDFYYPPKALPIVGPVLLALWIGLLLGKSTPTSDELQIIARLQQLEVGIALVFVPLTIFAIGLSSRRTESGVSAAEVLLAETFLFPIAIFVLGLLGSFVFMKHPVGARLLILLTLLCAGFSLYRLCITLLDEHHLHSAAIRLLQDKVRRSIGSAVDGRMGRNLLLNKLEGQPIEYAPFSSTKSSAEYLRVSSNEEGVVSDVHIDRLLRFSQQLEQAANEAGYSFETREVALESGGSDSEIPSIPRFRELGRETRRYITKLYGEPVSSSSDCLIAFPRKLVQQASRRKDLIESARSVFVIKRGRSYSQHVRRYLAGVKDDAILAIRDHRTSHLEKLLDVYIAAAETFLQEMEKLGGYSLEAARRERGNFIGGWEELKWISTDLRELHRRGCLAGDVYIARLVSGVPAKIAFAAIRHGDHLLFDEFTRFALYQYYTLDEVENPSVKKVLFDSVWRYLHELGNYGISFELQHGAHEAQAVESIGSLATILLLRYQHLLKLSFEKERIDDFRKFKSEVYVLCSYLDRDGRDHLGGPPDALLEEDRASLNRAKRRKEALRKVFQTIQGQKQELFFALGSMIFQKIAQCDVQRPVDYLTETAEIADAAELSELYLRMRQPAAEQLWAWEMQEIPDGAGAVADPFLKFDEYFCYLLLKLVQPFNDDRFQNLRLSTERDFVQELGGNGTLSSIFSSFQENRERWRRVVPDDWLAKIPNLRNIFGTLTSELLRSDEAAVIQASINADYVKDFRQRFVQAFQAEAGLRRIFKHFGAYEALSDIAVPQTPQARWGFSLLDLKASYIEGIRKAYIKWPEQYAKNLASSESETAFHQLLEQLPECDLTQGGASSVARLRYLLEQLGRTDVRSSAVFVASHNAFYRNELADIFTPEPRITRHTFKSIPEFHGWLNLQASRIPVFRAWTRQDNGWGCAVTFPEEVVWKQQTPVDSESELKDVAEFFYLSISDLSKETETRERILREDPAWLRDETDKERYLLQRVWLRVFERFEIKLLSTAASLKFRLPE